jgi:hypothetical protein
VTLKRLIITFKRKEIIVHAIYRTHDGSNPGAKARRKEVAELARIGLTQALDILEGIEVVGTSGFTQREDVLLATTSPETAKLVKEA